MIVCIPTKGRTNTSIYKHFNAVGIEVYHFIEPNEIDLYDVPNKISIEKNNQGICYVRNFILDYANKNNIQWIIMCDDDVRHFGIYNGKTIKADASIWFDIYNKAKQLPFELYAINYRQNAWRCETSYSINKTFAEVCVLMNVSKINWRYRPEYKLKHDRDFTLQTIKNGNGVIRFNHYLFNAPDIGSNQGGLYNDYQKKNDLEGAYAMVKEWHPFAQLKVKNLNVKRIDIKVNIKELALNYNKKIK